MTVRVVIPWRGGNPHREAALHRVLAWWGENHPTWKVSIGEHPADMGPWCKSYAVATAAPVAYNDVVVVSDADVICEQVGEAVAAVSGDRPQYLWGMPHRTVHRLTEHTTASVVDRSWWPSPDIPPRQLAQLVASTYTAYPGGGMVVVRGRILNAVPMDPRFTGWGQEDHSWSLALSMLAGAPWRGRGNLWHLWHPPEPRVSPGIGSQTGVALWHRYRSAATPNAMLALVAEARRELDALTR